ERYHCACKDDADEIEGDRRRNGKQPVHGDRAREHADREQRNAACPAREERRFEWCWRSHAAPAAIRSATLDVASCMFFRRISSRRVATAFPCAGAENSPESVESERSRKGPGPRLPGPRSGSETVEPARGGPHPDVAADDARRRNN